MSETTITPERVREFVIAGHSDLARVKQMLAETPGLLNIANKWREGDTETAVQAAAHVGNQAIAAYLLEQGAPLEICTAAMLGRIEDVEAFLESDPESIHATGAHNIPLLAHAVLSGDVSLVQMLYERGAKAGVSFALSNAVRRGDTAVAEWLLEHADPDLTWTDFQGKTVWDIAAEREDNAMMTLLRRFGLEAMG